MVTNSVFYILSFPVFTFFGFLFMVLSFMLKSLNLSIFLQWDFFGESFKFSFPIYVDFMSFFFLGLVLVISSSIMFYTSFYMNQDKNDSRFFFLMFLFILSMMFLILSPNLFSMLLGWDGLGLVSYCLVIYYQNYKSFTAGLVTALTNRIGDVFILGSISMFFYLGSWSYTNYLKFDGGLISILFVILASMTKSAQIPFSAWLPLAMAAPTPVSSLVHSSTLVTAGVYLLIRFYKYLEDTKLTLVLLCLSTLTMVMSGISGSLEFDLKKIIALSTLSQLGFMISTLCLGMVELTFFHLISHAFFKALLFMCAGILIHSFSDNQDIRFFGLLNKNFSLTLCMFNISNLSLCGFPFLSGFFSKDLILEIFIMKEVNLFFFFMLMLGTFLTVFYSIRLFLFLTFKFKFSLSTEKDENFFGIQTSLFFLMMMSITMGFFFSKLMIQPYNYVILPLNMKFFIFFLCMVSVYSSLTFSKYSFQLKLKKKYLFFFSMMWFLYFFKTDFLKTKFLKFSWVSNELTLGWTEVILNSKFLTFFFYLSKNFNKFSLNGILVYFSIIFSFVLFYFFFFI